METFLFLIMMAHLPQEKKPVTASTRAQGSAVGIRLRPVINTAGLLLFVGGSLSILLHGLSFFSAAAILFGGALVFINRHLRRTAPAFASNFAELTAQKEAQHKETKHYISKAQYLENVGDLGERTAGQLGQICERFKQFQDLLKQKFDPREMTFDRYFSAAEQAFDSVLEQLKLATASLNTLNAANPRYTEEQKKKLNSASPADLEQKRDLEAREELRGQQIKAITQLLAFNEKTITEFDRLSTALAQVVTVRGHSQAELEAMLGQLNELADRAKKYSIGGA